MPIGERISILVVIVVLGYGLYSVGYNAGAHRAIDIFKSELSKHDLCDPDNS